MTAIIIPTIDIARAEVTAAMALLNAGTDARIDIVGGEPRGFTATVNEGLERLRPGEDACILNDDITAFPYGWLAALRAGLYAADDYAISGPSGKSSTTPACHGKPGMVGLEDVAQLSFWCVLIKRAALDALGLLDARFIHYGSDNEYCHRARKHGYRLVWVRGVYLEHKHHGSGKRREWWERDRRLLMEVLR
jgi:hypothetical protein